MKASGSSVQQSSWRPRCWAQQRSYQSLEVGKPKIENFDDIQRHIRHWRQGGETFGEVQAVVQALHSLGPLPVWINPQHLVPFFSKQISNFCLRDIVMLYTWACKVGVEHKIFMTELTKRLQDSGSLKELDNKAIVLSICATARLTPLSKSTTVSTPVLNSLDVGNSCSEEELINTLASELVSPSRITKLTSQDLANTLFGLGWLGYQQRGVLDPLLEQLHQYGKLSQLSDQELVNGLHGLSLLGLKDQALVTAMLTESLSHSRTSKLSSKSLATLMQSMASFELDWSTDGDKLKLLMDKVVETEQLAGFQDHELSATLFSITQLQTKGLETDHETIRTLLEEAVSSSRREALSNEDLLSILSALGTSRYYEDTTIGILLSEVGQPERLATYSAGDIIGVIHSLDQMEVREGPLLEKLTKQLSIPEILSDIDDEQIFSVMMALMNLNFRHSSLISPLLGRALKSGGGLERMDLDQLSKYAFCLGKLGPGLNSDLEKILANAVKKPLTSVSNDSLKNLLEILGDVGQPGAELVPPVIEEFSKIKRLKQLLPEDVASAMYTLGRTRCGNPRVVDKLLWELTRKGVLRNVSNSTLSNVMYGLGQLRHVPSEGVLVLLEAEFARDHRIDTYTFQELANIIHSLGLLRLENREKVAAATETLAMLAVTDKKLDESSDVELACLLYGLCHLRYKNPHVLEPLMTLLVRKDRLAHFPNKDICNMIYAVGQMGYNTREHIQPLVQEAKHIERLSRYSPVQIATLIYSLGKIRYSDHPSVAIFVAEVLRPNRLGALKSQDLVSVLHGLVFTKLSTGNAAFQVLQEIGRMERRTDFIGSEVLTISKCLCNLRKNAPSRQVESLLEVFVYEMCRAERLSEFDARQLSQVAVILADAKSKDPGLVLQILRELTKGSTGKDLSLDDLARLVWSIGPTGQVNKEDRPMMAVYTRALIHMVAEREDGFSGMSSGHLAEMLIGMGCMGLRDYRIIDDLGEEIVQEHRIEFYRPWHLCKVFRALGQLQSQNKYVLKILSKEICKPENLEKMQPDQWSELMTAVVLLGHFQDANLFRAVASQVRVGNRDPVIKMEGVRTASRK